MKSFASPVRKSVVTALLLGGIMAGTSLPVVVLSPAQAAETAPAKEKVERPKSRTFTGDVTAADATSVTAKAKQRGGDVEEVKVSLMPDTTYMRIENNLEVSEIKAGDTLKFYLVGTDGMPTVQSVSPLVLKFGDKASLTLNQPDKMKFDKVTKIAAGDIAAGQNVKVASNFFADGHYEAREVWVNIDKPKPVKAVKTPKAKKE